MPKTKIQWTEETWNPIVGCSKISDGCRNCYAIPMAKRLEKMGDALVEQGKNPGRLAAYKGTTKPAYKGTDWTGVVRFVPEALEIPLLRQKPTTYFVNSMSDLFHHEVDTDWLLRIFQVMRDTPQHRYQILTKRPQGIPSLLSDFWHFCSIPVLENVRIGITAENQHEWNARSPYLKQISEMGWKTMISFEPLLGEVNIDDFLINNCWGIIGGESGANARLFDIEWGVSLVQQLFDDGIPPFVKQLGSNHNYPFKCGKKGDDFESWPSDLQVQEYPND